MHTLHLTQAEAKKFASLPEAVRSGFSVKSETLTYQDSPKRRSIRFELLSLKDPELVRFSNALKSDGSAFAKAVGSLDTKKINDAEFTQLLFALGPEAMSLIINDLLSSADDIETAAAFSELRHAMLESLTSALA